MTSETPTSYSIVVESKPSEVVRVCEEVMARLEEKGFGKDDVFAVRLTLEEAFLNAVKHGNKMDTSKTIRVDYSSVKTSSKLQSPIRARALSPIKSRIPGLVRPFSSREEEDCSL